MPQLRGQHPVGRDRRPAPLHMPEDRVARLDPAPALDLLSHHTPDPAKPLGLRGVRRRARVHPAPAGRRDALRDAHERELLPLPAARRDPLADTPDVVPDLRDQDDVRARRHPGMQRQPARVPPHDLHDHHPVVARGRRVHAVQGVRRRRNCRLKPEGDLRPHQVIVDRLGQPDAPDAPPPQTGRRRHRPVAPGDHQRLKPVRPHRRKATVAGIAPFPGPIAARRPPERVRRVRGPEDRPARREDAGHITRAERSRSVFNKPRVPVQQTDHLKPVPDRIFRNDPDHRVQTRAVAAAGQNPDALRHGCPSSETRRRPAGAHPRRTLPAPMDHDALVAAHPPGKTAPLRRTHRAAAPDRGSFPVEARAPSRHPLHAPQAAPVQRPERCATNRRRRSAQGKETP